MAFGIPGTLSTEPAGLRTFFGLLQGSRSYFPIDDVSPHRVLQVNGKPTPEGGYTTDRIGQGAVDFINEQGDEPFFLFVSFTAPHGPLQPKPEIESELSGIKDPKRRKYVGLVKNLDENVGRILDAIEAKGLRERTLIIFTNDNGGQVLTGANNSPLRGKKGDVWEGGLRVPMAMQWPGRIPSGVVCDTPVITLDFLPTFMKVAGGGGENANALDGMDLTPLFKNPSTTSDARNLFWRTHGSKGQVAVRNGDWKLVWQRDKPDTEPKLFNLANDVAENDNVAESHPERVNEMLSAIQEWEQELEEPRWGQAAE
ncbi:MAG: sulfatase-like hydrolase/transferase [Pirellulaceae bacterium]